MVYFGLRLNTYFVLGVIVLLAFFLRIVGVGAVPPSLNWDEVSIGYNAYSIYKTGKDEWGKFMPLNFRSYGEFKLPAQIYASVPGVAIFGLTPVGVRITPILYGTLTVLLTFFLARKIFQNVNIGLLAAALLAISPWHIQLTRASFEASFSLVWIVLGVWLFLKGTERGVWWMASAVSFAVSVYTYNSARVFTPLFLVAVLLIYRKLILKQWRWAALAAGVFALFLLPLVPVVTSGDVRARYKLVSITDDPGLVLRINENRGNSSLPRPLPRLIHNKGTYISLEVLRNYLSHFSPQYLFITGAPHKQHHVQNMGQLYIFEAPLILAGFWFLIRGNYKFKWLVLVWLILAFAPVSVTKDSIPHALRTVIVLPVYQLIAAVGLWGLFRNIRIKRWRVVFCATVGLLVAVGFLYYLYQYFVIYPKNYSRDWQYGYRQVVDFIREHQDEYDLVVFTRFYGEPHMFSAFYLPVEPSDYISDPNLVRFETFDWVRVLNYGKFYFPDLGDYGTRYEDIIKYNPNKKILFIGKPSDFPVDKPVVEQIDFLNGVPAFEIVEKK